MKWELGLSRYKLFYTEWIHNEVLLYSPGDCIQHPGRNHNGKEYFFKKHVYVKLNHLAAQQ